MSSRPDLPGFGQSDMPAAGQVHLHVRQYRRRYRPLHRNVGYDRYALYVFDYGAPTGFRIALKHPERITAIVSQNGNAYEEGLSDGWNPDSAYWKAPTEANREALRALLTKETTIWQYTHGVTDPSSAVSPTAIRSTTST